MNPTSQSNPTRLSSRTSKLSRRSKPDPSIDGARRPYAVCVAGARRGAFEDLRDAIASARLAKRDNCHAAVIVTDVATGQIVIEIEP